MVPILTSAIQEQQQIIEEQKQRLDKQELLINDLISRMEAVEKK